MNATSYYVSTCRLVVQADPSNPGSWQDIVRFLPMLRNSLSCTVCENLLSEPYTPEETSCQHHVCKGCRGGAKVLRPSCSWCRDYNKYKENPQLRILLQSYRSLCSYIKVTQLYQLLRRNKEHGEHISEIIRESEAGMNHVPSSPSTPPVSSPNPFAALKSLGPLSQTQTSSASTATTKSSHHRSPASLVVAEREDLEGQDNTDCARQEDFETETVAGKWYSVSSAGDLIPEEGHHEPAAEADQQGHLLPGGDGGQDITTSIIQREHLIQESPDKDSSQCEPAQPRKLRHGRVSGSKLGTASPKSSLSSRVSSSSANHHTVCSQPSVILKDEMFTSPNIKTEVHCEEQRVDDEVSFRISSPAISKALFLDSPEVKQELAKDLVVSRSDTPSPPNSSRYSSLTSDPGKLRITESYILKPRQSGVETHSLLCQDDTTSSRIPVMLSRAESDTSNPGSLLRPLLEEEGVDPLLHSSPGGRTKKQAEEGSGKAEKQGCRCGNATQTPGKLTCCGQRCPCYVNRSACMGCKCKGCNNPNLPGGGKILPYLDVAINSKNPNKLHSYSSLGKARSLGGAAANRGANVMAASRGASMVGTSRGATAAATGRTGVALGSRGSVESPGNLIQVPATSQSSDSMDVDINTIPVVNLSSPSSVRTLLGPSSAVQRLLSPNKTVAASSSSSTFLTQASTPSSLPTVTIPISSLGPGLKLRPVQQMQGRDLKTARVIPTIKVRGAPYSRLPVNGKVNVGHVRLQAVSLVTLLKNQKNIQVVRKETEDSENKPTSS